MTDPATLQRCLAYVETQVGPQTQHLRARSAPTLTLSRQTGAGGLSVANCLASNLQQQRPASPVPWTVFHRGLVEKVLEEHNLPAQFARYMPEDRVSYIQDTMEELLGLHPSSSSLVVGVTETILGLAELGHCILVGRGAHFILAECPTAFHVRLISSLPKRIERVAADRQLTPEQAAEAIHQEDSARARYLKTHFDAEIDDPLAYHLVINMDTFRPEDAATLITQAVLQRFPPRPA